MNLESIMDRLTDEPTCLVAMSPSELHTLAILWRRLSRIGGSAIDDAVARAHAPVMDHGIPVDRCRHG